MIFSFYSRSTMKQKRKPGAPVVTLLHRGPVRILNPGGLTFLKEVKISIKKYIIFFVLKLSRDKSPSVPSIMGLRIQLLFRTEFWLEKFKDILSVPSKASAFFKNFHWNSDRKSSWLRLRDSVWYVPISQNTHFFCQFLSIVNFDSFFLFKRCTCFKIAIPDVAPT